MLKPKLWRAFTGRRRRLVAIFRSLGELAGRKKFTYNFPLDRVKLINELRFFFRYHTCAPNVRKKLSPFLSAG